MRNLPRLVVIVGFVILAGGMWFGFAQEPAAPKPAAQTPPPAAKPETPQPPIYPAMEKKLDGGYFQHSDHPTGEVAVYDKEQKQVNGGRDTIKLDCNFCHLVDEKEVRNSGFGEYPFESKEVVEKTTGTRMKSALDHTACTVCHNFRPPTGNRAKLVRWQQMCAVCHQGSALNKNINPFPFEKRQTQFGALYSHNLSAHVKLECETCHAVQAMKPTAESRNLFSSRPEHRECFICHIEKAKELTGNEAAKPYATDCAGCHTQETSPDRTLFRDPIYTAITSEFQHGGAHAVYNKQWNSAKPFETIEFLTKLGKVPPTQAMTSPDAAAKQTTLSCKSCHGNLLVLSKELRDARPRKGKKDEATFKKEKLEWDWRVQLEARRHPTYLASQACTGCHTFEKIEKDEANPKFQKIDRFPVFIPQQNAFGTVFNIGSCDSCHPTDVTKRGTPESHKLRRPKPAAPPSGKPGL